MSDDENNPILQAALDRLGELNEERRELEAFIALHRKLAARIAKGVRHYKVANPADVAHRTLEPTPSGSDEILAGIRGVMREHGGPIPLADLHAGLTRRGIIIPGKDPRNNLSQRLSSSGEFSGKRGVGWWFANEWPQEKRLSEADGS